MSLSSLYETVWAFNTVAATPVNPSSKQYTVTGYCGSGGFTSSDVFIGLNVGYNKKETSYNFVSVNRNESEAENIVENARPKFKIIKFMDGEDIADPDLIAWVEDVAVRATVLDLSTLSSVPGGFWTVTAKAKAPKYTTSLVSNGIVYGFPYNIIPDLDVHITESPNNVKKIAPRSSSTVTLVYYSDDGYELPSTISVDGAVYAWNIGTAYTVSGVATNALIEGGLSYSEAIGDGDDITISISADGTEYRVPPTIPTFQGTVDSSEYTIIDLKRAEIKLIGVHSDISLEVNGTALEYPKKGDLIDMTLGNPTPEKGTQDRYRVLTIDGTVAEVMAMYSVSESCYYNSADETEYAGTGEQDLDVILNTTFYNSLNNVAKANIVSKDITCYKYTYDASVYGDSHASYANYSTKTVNEVVNDRYVYALDVEDIEKYFNYFSSDNLNSFFGKDESGIGEAGCLFRSIAKVSGAYSNLAYAWNYNKKDLSSGGIIINTRCNSGSHSARPVFNIDLSQIGWVPVTEDAQGG